jgi:mannose-6-phosphate isomerase-like protein (cupin superfamily)
MPFSDQSFITFKQFKFRILKTGKETDGEYDLLEYILSPKERYTPVHYHKDFSEKFTVIKGMMILEVGKKFILLTPGDSHTVPPNKLHTFLNHTSEDVRFTTELRPASEPFIKAMIIRQGLIKDGLCNKYGIPKKLSYLIILASLSRSYVAGFSGFLQKIFLARAKTKKFQALEKELIEKYYNRYL